MGMKSQKCCCCPSCTTKAGCCKCVCRRICVTFTPDAEINSDYFPCEEVSTEVEYDGEAWVGSVNGIDFRYYFENVYGDCYFKLRSIALGFDEGNERAWLVGDDAYSIQCSNPITSVDVGAYGDECSAGVLTTACASKVVPRHCTGCDCVCECLCITYARGGCVASGKACWDGYGNWRVTLQCGAYADPVEIVIALFARADTCDDYVDPYCDKTDRTCVLLMSLDNEPGGAAEPTCPDISATWTLGEYGETPTVITARCAVCNEDCTPEVTPCCEGYAIPETMFCTMEGYITVYDNFASGAIVFDQYCNTTTYSMARQGDGYIWISDDIANTPCVCGDNTVTQNYVNTKMILTCDATPDVDGSRFSYLLAYADDSPCFGQGTPPPSGALGVVACSPFFATAENSFAGLGFLCCLPEFVLSGGAGQYAVVMRYVMTFTG